MSITEIKELLAQSQRSLKSGLPAAMVFEKQLVPAIMALADIVETQGRDEVAETPPLAIPAAAAPTDEAPSAAEPVDRFVALCTESPKRAGDLGAALELSKDVAERHAKALCDRGLLVRKQGGWFCVPKVAVESGAKDGD